MFEMSIQQQKHTQSEDIRRLKIIAIINICNSEGKNDTCFNTK